MPKKNNQPKPKTNFPQMEEDILKFWQENKIFAKSVEKDASRGDYVFYDGPPFATGTPHYGHIVASTMKDVIPRFKTMRGFRVERQWGWDCHGLPVENLVEQELNLKTKKDIEEMGIDKFNDACCKSVMRYAGEWKKFIPRMGRWVDMENDYKTMNPEYMESIWWVFKQLWDKDLIYEGHKSMHLCPRCETTLSNFEVTQGYKEVKDLSVVAKFRIKNLESRIKNIDLLGDVYALAWTTTPWTLPGNAALAVGEDIDYSIFQVSDSDLPNLKQGDIYIVASNYKFGGTIAEHFTSDEPEPKIVYQKNKNKNVYVKEFKEFTEDGGIILHQVSDNPKISSLDANINGKNVSFVKLHSFKGKDLVGLEYEPLFPYFAKTSNNGSPTSSVEVGLPGRENGWKIYAGDFVSTEEGTGIVHIAPAFGEDDMNLAKKYELPFIQHAKMNGQFVDEVKDFAGMEVKPKDDPTKTDIEIIKWLAKNNKLFSKERYKHSYPHCWRCDTPLLNYSTSSWFVKVTEIKDQLLKNNKETNWIPEHIRDGRFGKWLEGARDWAISRNRYWGAPLPVWKCGNENCDEIKAIGSIEELEELSNQKITNLHKQFVDKIEFKCEKCGGTMKRIPEVLDCWFESGSMPYASFHYPFENKEKFEKNFPAQFIAEGIDQTRGWFYTLMVLSTALFDKPAFKNVIVNGIVLAEDGQKMSKRLKNYPDPNYLINKYGADAMRYYLMSSPVVKGGDLNFSEKGVDEVFKKVIMLLWNVYSFYETYADQLVGAGHCPVPTADNILDKWILAKLNLLIKEVTENLEKYDLQKASRPILEFINELSTWYLRRSRERFKGTASASAKAMADKEEDKQNALQTTNYVLLTLSKLMAPFMPFIAESLYQRLTQIRRESGTRIGCESVHLEEWPKIESGIMNYESGIIKEMDVVRKIVEQGLAIRAEVDIKVRQILSKLYINYELSKELLKLIKDELNVKEIKIISKDKFLKEKGWIMKQIEFKGKAISIILNTELTPELELEGYAREIVRTINLLRRDAGLSINDTAEIYYNDNAEIKEVFAKHGDDIMRDTLCISHEPADMGQIEVKKEIKIGDEKVFIGIKSTG
jgi:isoleucyl-tRNA synthetase